MAVILSNNNTFLIFTIFIKSSILTFIQISNMIKIFASK